MRALLTTASLALLLSAAPAIAQQKPDSGPKSKPAHSMPAASATTPSATAAPATAPTAKPAKGKKHRKPKAPAETKPSN